MVIVCTSISSSRLDYTLAELFTRRLGIPFTAVQSAQDAEISENDICICYDKKPIQGWFHIEPNAEIWNIGTTTTASFTIKGGLPVLFANDSEFGFDIFAMIFWCLSRMEEYLPFEADEHGRFTSKSSVAGKAGFLEKPYLDFAIQYFCGFYDIFMPDKFGIYPTIDIDIAYKYSGRSMGRSIGSFCKQIIKGDFLGLKERMATWLGKVDPWDTYDYLLKSLGKNDRNARLFVLMSRQRKYDKAILPDFTPWYNRLQQLSKKLVIGIHPGYNTGQSTMSIVAEKNELQNICGQTISRSRQHFLRVQIPGTYMQIAAAGIDHEYSMGFADAFGFRAGTGHSFRFYNLQTEETSTLIVHPFCAMEVSAKNYMQLSAEEAAEKGNILKENCRKAGAPFCFIFHNESLSEDQQWRGWRKVWEKWLE